MQRRIRKTVSTRVDTSETTVRVASILVKNSSRLVTLEDPKGPSTLAQDAFCRLKPPEGTLPGEIDSWRNLVAKVAKAVKVLPVLQAADVPIDSHRTVDGEKIGTIREEALALAKETKNPAVVKLVTEILDEVNAQ